MVRDEVKANKQIEIVVEIYNDIESYMIEQVSRVFKADKNMTDNQKWQVKKLGQIDAVRRRNEKYMNKRVKEAYKEIDKLLREEGIDSLQDSEDILLNAVEKGKLQPFKPLEESEQIENIIKIWEEQTFEYLNIANNNMIGAASSAIRKIVSESTLSSVIGVESRQSIVRKALKRFAEEGPPAIIDRAGRRWSAYAYVNMRLTVNANDLTSELQMERSKEVGSDLVEVSSHNASRPSHAKWQGKVYSISGNSNKYPSFYGVTKYGQKVESALGTYGCRHFFYPYIEGLSRKAYSPYPARENDKAYRESQEQRRLERVVRKKKDILRAMQTMNDEQGIKDAKAEIRLAQANLRQFIKDTGRTRRYNREI